MKTITKIQEIQKSIKHLVLNKPEFMTYQAAAIYIGRKYGTVRKLVWDGTFTPIKNGGYRYLRTADLDAFMNGEIQNGSNRYKDAGGDEGRNNGKGKATPSQVPQAQ